MSRRWIIALLLSLGVMAGAFALDAPVATAIHQLRWDEKHHDAVSIIRETIKLAGFFPTTIVMAAIISWLHPLRWRAGLFLILASLPAALNEPIKFVAGRLRPFKAPNMRADEWMAVAKPFDWHPFVHSNNRSFPSGHAALAFATAMALSILFPRGRAWFFAGATIVGLERITENAHWCSDVTAATILGIGGAVFVHWLLARKRFFETSSAAHGQLV